MKFNEPLYQLTDKEMFWVKVYTYGMTVALIAFPGGRGTQNCIDQAKHLGMIVMEVL